MINKRLLIYVYWWDSVVVCNQRYLVEGEVYQPQKYLGTACRSTKAWRTCIRNEALHKNTRLYPRKAKEFVSDVCWCDQPLRTVYSSASNWWPHFSKAAFEDRSCHSGATRPSHFKKAHSNASMEPTTGSTEAFPIPRFIARRRWLTTMVDTRSIMANEYTFKSKYGVTNHLNKQHKC